MQFTGQQLLTIARTAIMAAQDRNYLIDLESFLKDHKGEKVAHNFQWLSMWLNLNLNHFDEKLLITELEMYKNGDYQPDTKYRTRNYEQTNTELMTKAIYSTKKKHQ
ncbi:hypothetical protein [Psychrobacter pygoscelis]|uniref:hypothetical protein n=1 Tax=Psychrobacter pygoscelis TaxID=2488563 RepID=UPI001A9547BD|nr:hypothetical protein [Psychrobacter pygoscelis]